MADQENTFVRKRIQSIIEYLKKEEIVFKGYSPDQGQMLQLSCLLNGKKETLREVANQLNSYSCSKFPQESISWYYIRHKSGWIGFICSGFQYKCSAQIKYTFDQKDKCFYLASCVNWHSHTHTTQKIYKMIGLTRYSRTRYFSDKEGDRIVLSRFENLLRKMNEKKKDKKISINLLHEQEEKTDSSRKKGHQNKYYEKSKPEQSYDPSNK